MINTGYYMNTEDIKKFKKFKDSPAYGSYLISISNSPIYKTLINDYLKNIDITPDAQYFKDKGLLPDNIDLKSINELFMQSLTKMITNVAADVVILKEIENIKISDITEDISKESDILYLLGKADDKYYVQAKKLLDENKLEESSLVYKGLINYLKNNIIKETTVVKPTKNITKQSSINLDSNEIDL